MYRKLLSLFILLTIFKTEMFAQASSVSPYTRYGLGDIYDLQFAQNTGMGGISIAMSDSFLINVANPASYGQLVKFNPVLDVGARGRMFKFITTSDSIRTYTVSLSNLVLALPLNKRTGLAFGIVPLSSAGYNISYNVTEPTIGNVRYDYQGNGGINRVFVGLGYSAIRNSKNVLSFGFNASFLFGEIQKVRKIIYNTSGTYNTKIVNSLFIRDFAFDAGLLYKNTISKKLVFRLGVTYGVPTEINATRTLLAHTFTSAFSENIVDTVEFQDNVKGYFTLPVKWGYGISFDIKGNHSNNPSKFTIGLQYQHQNWSGYRENFGSDIQYDYLKNSSSMHLGIQFIPKTLGTGKTQLSTFALTNYRLGVYQKTSYLSLQGARIVDKGITFGMGIPLIYSYSYSMLNFGFEFGTRGTTDNNLILEKYIGFHIGYAFSPNRQSDRWFVKRRFD